MVRLCPKTPLLWSTLTNKDSYWTPSRCAKILIVVFVTGLPANLYISKEMWWRWLKIGWPFVGTSPRASAAVLYVNITTSQWLCLQPPSWLLWPLLYNNSSSSSKNKITTFHTHNDKTPKI